MSYDTIADYDCYALKGHILAGDADGAMKGLRRLLKEARQ